MGFRDTVEAVVDALHTAGLEAAADVRDVNPPGVLVVVATLIPADRMCGVQTLRMYLDLVARDSGDLDALDQLDALHDTIRAAVLPGRIMPTDATFDRRNLGDPTSLPRLRLTLETRMQ